LVIGIYLAIDAWRLRFNPPTQKATVCEAVEEYVEGIPYEAHMSVVGYASEGSAL
jgi:hypothetical protein